MPKRRSMNKRKTAFCYWCRRSLQPSYSSQLLAFTKDHIVPRAMGGTKWLPCCRACNHMKEDMHPEKWREFIKKYPRWWDMYPKTAAAIIREDMLND